MVCYINVFIFVVVESRYQKFEKEWVYRMVWQVSKVQVVYLCGKIIDFLFFEYVKELKCQVDQVEVCVMFYWVEVINILVKIVEEFNLLILVEIISDVSLNIGKVGGIFVSYI